jgi:hypothetical protein
MPLKNSGLDGMNDKSYPYWELESFLSAVKPVASCYTNALSRILPANTVIIQCHLNYSDTG